MVNKTIQSCYRDQGQIFTQMFFFSPALFSSIFFWDEQCVLLDKQLHYNPWLSFEQNCTIPCKTNAGLFLSNNAWQTSGHRRTYFMPCESVTFWWNGKHQWLLPLSWQTNVSLNSINCFNCLLLLSTLKNRTLWPKARNQTLRNHVQRWLLNFINPFRRSYHENQDYSWLAGHSMIHTQIHCEKLTTKPILIR